jgi:uncharacterized membrane protein YhaH (DUF805 family)
MRDFFSALGFKGRIGRGRYWLLTGLYFLTLIVGLAVFAVTGAMLDAHPGDAITLVMVPIGIIFILAMFIAIAGAGVRRLHDRGKTGFWLCLYYGAPLWLSKGAYFDVVGYVSLAIALGVFIWAIVDLGVLRGDSETNSFGPNPIPRGLEPQTS